MWGVNRVCWPAAQTLHLHIGADLHVPVASNRYEHPGCAAQQQEEAAGKDPFDGLPLRAWAERLGERIMPAYELIKEEQAAAKRATKAHDRRVADLPVPAVPHFLPITKWRACCPPTHACCCYLPSRLKL